MIGLLIIWTVGTVVGMAAVAALDQWVRHHHPDRWRATTGLDPAPGRVRRQRADQLAETRRREGTPTWRTR